MKKVILSLLATLSIMICHGQTTITAIAGTNRWDVAASWDLNRVPQGNDRVVIPVGRTIEIRNPNTVPGTIGVRINLYGTLSFPTNGADKIGLPCNSIIQIYSAGSIISTGGSNADLIDICGTTIWSSVTGPNPQTGPAYSQYPSYGFVSGTLPVRLSSFEITKNQNQVILNWSTEIEQNNNYFEIQRSFPGQSWISAGRINAGSQPNGKQHYQFIDQTTGLTGTVFYRLKQVDIDNKFEYSSVKAVIHNKVGKNILVFPNPAKEQVNIFWDAAAFRGEKIKISMININGETVWQGNPSTFANIVQINGSQFAKGQYLVSLQTESGLIFNTTLLLQ